MPENVINCQNLPCPQPVILTKKMITADAPETLTVIVDNEAAYENVGRFLASQRYDVTWRKDQAGLWHITGRKGEGKALPEPEINCPIEAPPLGKTMILVSSAVFGSGDDMLGGKLMKNFLATLPEMGPELWLLVFVNGGVTLTVQDSPVLEDIVRLEKAGVTVLVCGACLEHYKLMAHKAVGQTTNMLDIVMGMQLADKVLRI